MTPNWEKRYCKKSPNILGIPSTKEILEISALLPPAFPPVKKTFVMKLVSLISALLRICWNKVSSVAFSA